MSTNFKNTAPFLRTSRLFPQDDPEGLLVEIDKSYVDTASAVNARTIGVFSVNTPGVNGEAWFLAGGNKKLQGLRQVYQFTAAGNIPHGINLTSVNQFTKCTGAYTDGTNWYGVLFGSTIVGNITFYVTPTNIVVQAGAGAPAIVSGTIVLEWISRT